MSLDRQEINRNKGIEVIIRHNTARFESRCGTMETGLRVPRPWSEHLCKVSEPSGSRRRPRRVRLGAREGTS